MSFMSRSAAALGALAAAGAVVVTAPAAQAAPAAAPAAAKAPWIRVSLNPTVKGQTVTFRYSERGAQRLVSDDRSKKRYNNKQSAGFLVTLDGRTVAGGDGLGDAHCTTKGLASFRDSSPKVTVKLAKGGKHTLRVSTSYCGATGLQRVSRSYTVTTKSSKTTPKPKPSPKVKATLKAGGSYTPGKPFSLSGTCSSSKTATATVVGPRDIHAQLKRAGKNTRLTGQITVPKALKGSWVRLHMTCADGSSATTIAKRVGAKGSIPTA